MPVAVGALIVDGLAAAGVGGVAGFSLASTTIFGVGISTVLGTAAVLGASIGLQAALARSPPTPSPENGTQPIQQAVPPRIRGYGRNRMAGYYMLFEEVNTTSYDVIAFHSGRIGSISGVYLHDDAVTLATSGPYGPGTGGPSYVLDTFGDGRYGNSNVAIQIAVGSDTQSAAWFAGLFGTDSVWGVDFKGEGIASLAMLCQTPANPSDYTKYYPHGLPVPSVVADLSPVWDPRDPAQSRSDASTWLVSYNPVLQLIDYLTCADGGMGLDYDTIIAPRLAEWITEASLCDELVDRADGSQEPRYTSNGWFQFDNNPEDVINGILSTCDGWMCEDVDGTMALKIGVYRLPDGEPISGSQILGFTNIQFGQADENTINEVDFTFTDPNQAFATTQPSPYRDEDAISASGVVRAKSLDLKWVQSNGQASRLAARALLRLNPDITCTIITDLTALDWVGERWVPLQYPFIAGLENCVMENQGAEIDLGAGRITFNFNLVIPTEVDDYNPVTDEKPAPPIPGVSPGASAPVMTREDGSALTREDGSYFIRETT